MPKRLRTGCGTCKQRKVLCDRTQPSCQRCDRAKLLCQGYLPSSTSSTCLSSRTTESVSALRPKDSFTFYRQLRQFEDLDRIDYAAFDFCRRNTVQQVCSQRHFWTTTVLAAAEHNGAILHALLALAGAHRTKTERLVSGGQQVYEVSSGANAADGHYYKAAHLLRQQIDQDGIKDLSSILIACLVLLTCDLIQSRYGEAFLHLQNGRRLLISVLGLAKQDGQTLQLLLADTADSVMDELTYEFASFDVQSANFGDLATHFVLADRSKNVDIRIPPAFTGIDDAERYLLIIHNCLIQLGRAESRDGQQILADVTAQATAWQSSALSMLRQWSAALRNSPLHPLSKPSDPVISAYQRQYSSCLLRHACLMVFTEASYSTGNEVAFDRLLPQFCKIISLCEELQPAQPGVSIDIGIIQPLFTLGCYCRHPDVRRRCLQVLSRAGVEGHWDSRLVRLLTSYRMEMEEAEAGYIHDPTAAFPDDPELLSATIPANARYNQSFAFFLNGSYSQVEIQLRRMGPEGAMEIKRKIVDFPPVD